MFEFLTLNCARGFIQIQAEKKANQLPKLISACPGLLKSSTAATVTRWTPVSPRGRNDIKSGGLFLNTD